MSPRPPRMRPGARSVAWKLRSAWTPDLGPSYAKGYHQRPLHSRRKCHEGEQSPHVRSRRPTKTKAGNSVNLDITRTKDTSGLAAWQWVLSYP